MKFKRHPPAPTPYSMERQKRLEARAKAYRYVEVTNGERFRGVIPDDRVTIKEADRIAIEDAAHAWGKPKESIEVFVSRTLTDAQHERLVAKMIDGTLDPDWWLGGSGKIRA